MADTEASNSSASAAWRPKALLFDLLTALLDSWSLWNACAGSAAHGRKWRDAYLALTFGTGAYVPYPSLVRQAAVESRIPDGEKCADELMRRWDELRSWPEVEAVLEKCKAKGWKLGVVTNCSEDLGKRAVSRVGVDFAVVITAEQSGYDLWPVLYSRRQRTLLMMS